MNIDEAKKILSIIRMAYPGRINRGEAETVALLWQTVFQKATYDEVKRALIKYIRESSTGYMPVPGQIHQMVLDERAGREAREVGRIFYDLQNEGMSLY